MIASHSFGLIVLIMSVPCRKGSGVYRKYNGEISVWVKCDRGGGRIGFRPNVPRCRYGDRLSSCTTGGVFLYSMDNRQ